MGSKSIIRVVLGPDPDDASRWVSFYKAFGFLGLRPERLLVEFRRSDRSGRLRVRQGRLIAPGTPVRARVVDDATYLNRGVIVTPLSAFPPPGWVQSPAKQAEGWAMWRPQYREEDGFALLPVEPASILPAVPRGRRSRPTADRRRGAPLLEW